YPVDEEGLAAQAGSIGGMNIEGVSSNDAPHYPLSIIVMAKQEIVLSFEYLPRYFDESEVEAIGHRVVRVLEQFVADTSAPVGDLDVVVGDEGARVVEVWNDTARGGDGPVSLPGVFVEQVRRSPDAVAVVFEGESLTYGEFASRVNRLARHLISLGVGPES